MLKLFIVHIKKIKIKKISQGLLKWLSGDHYVLRNI